MGKKLTESQSTQNQQSTQQSTQTGNQSFQNDFKFLQQPENAYLTKAAGLIDGYDGGASAAREGYGRNKADIANSGNELFGANTPDYVRDKVRSDRYFKNNLDLGSNLAGAEQNALQTKQAGYTTLGQLTAPQLVQSGGNSSGTASMTGSATSAAQGTGYTPLLGTLGSSFMGGLGGTTGKELGL